ncbi:hypothetical protein EDB81DRAFT_880601 [Dactylonectria macrodidyma]|uniref:Uncharacterized protein n=1 Tax=Dactylonectria macrodidyma TaxID=307937 RepID=A0A9P9F9K1_9HYPO|nr:hypothetical protein EDB81DRAFT_880601 [Dactylonectria macrodidyma]
MEPHSPGMVQDDTFTSIGRDIPNVTKLCEELGYEPRRSPLKTAMDRYIYEFTTDRGEKGESFTRRKEPLHEAGIRSLTEKFLDQDGNGPLFWPDHPAFPWSGRLQYSTHRDQIRSAVHKLFWRYIVQNKQNNQKRDNQKQNKKKQKKQEHRVPRDKNAPKPRRRVAAQKGVATHQVQSRENSVGFEQPPHASAVSVPIVPETNESAEIPSPAITPRPASPLFPKYIEESVGDCNIQDARGESHATGELLSQPVVPMAPMTDGLDDGPSRQNETTTAGQVSLAIEMFTFIQSHVNES